MHAAATAPVLVWAPRCRKRAVAACYHLPSPWRSEAPGGSAPGNSVSHRSWGGGPKSGAMKLALGAPQLDELGAMDRLGTSKSAPSRKPAPVALMFAQRAPISERSGIRGAPGRPPHKPSGGPSELTPPTSLTDGHGRIGTCVPLYSKRVAVLQPLGKRRACMLACGEVGLGAISAWAVSAASVSRPSAP